MKRTKKLTFCAMMTAMATVLMLLSKLIPSPWLQGGSVTIASAVPIIAASLIYGWKWGILTSLTYAIIQLITGFYPPPTQNLLSFILVIVFDYLFAFGILGIAGIFYKKKKPFTIPLSGFIVTFLRYICHIISGILIWGVYKDASQTLIGYSIIYNGSYMIPEIIITTVTLAFLIKILQKVRENRR